MRRTDKGAWIPEPRVNRRIAQRTVRLLQHGLLGVAVVSGLGLGCSANLYKVGGEEANGIPFYVKKGACKNTTVFVEPLYTVALQERPRSPLFSSETSTSTSWRTVGNMQLTRLGFLAAWSDHKKGLPALSRKPDWTSFGTFLMEFEKYRPEYVKPGLPKQSDNYHTYRYESSLEAFVDYKTEKRINVRRPLLGKASATVKLAPDGTLTETSADAEEKVLEALPDLIPLKEYLLKSLDIGSPEAEKVDGVEYRIELSTTHWAHSFWKLSELEPNLGCSQSQIYDPDSSDYKQFQYQRQEIKPVKKSDKGDECKISFDGSIVLPKPKSSN